MPIEIDDGATGVRLPVVKRTTIGERFAGCIALFPEQRDVLKKDGTPALNGRGKARQELVITCLTMPGTTANAGIGDEIGVPAAGDPVRLIQRGGGFAQWIDAKKAVGGKLYIGDIVESVMEYGQVYDADGNPMGQKLYSQADVDRVPRHQVVGIYGSLSIRRPTADEQRWLNAAEDYYRQQTAIAVPAFADDVPVI
jgi:alkylated DNA nucleotide flippase Atl1